MTPEIISIITVFSSEFNRPTWKKMQTRFIGAILCRRVRRVTRIVRVMNLGQDRNFSKYHRVLNHASWNGVALSKILLGLLIKLIPESWPILVAVDDRAYARKNT